MRSNCERCVTGAVSLAELVELESPDALSAVHSQLASHAPLASQPGNSDYLPGAFDRLAAAAQAAEEGRRWDVIVLDPPKLAPSRKSLSRAASKCVPSRTTSDLSCPLPLVIAMRAHSDQPSSGICHRNDARAWVVLPIC